MARLYELLARIKPDGSFALAARDVTTVNGKDYEGDARPVQATDADVVAFVGLFNATAVADAAAKATTISGLNASLATMTTARDELAAQLTAANDANTAKAATIAELQTTIDQLRNPTRAPNVITPREFLNRFTDEELDGIQIAGIEQTGPVRIAALRAQRLLFSQLEVNLDHADTINGVNSLAAVGLIAAERVADILAPRIQP